ncbi:MAG: DUF87 domain-containing protein [Rickettsiales bacterium]|jgi:S-DNA-T family DNA segregation ATPase FtsK/SpoIIIE|nr:DUF87 domain-containing protein [Rickettsiales bacterium]
MKDKIPILPKKLAAALLRVAGMLLGAALAACALAAIISLFSPSGAATWTRASTLPPATYAMKVLDLLRYALGTPALMFVLMFLLRPAAMLMSGISRPKPEVVAMRVFLAAAAFSAALALLLPGSFAGGAFGTFAARDLTALFGPWAGLAFGSLFLGFFVALGASSLKITFSAALLVFYKIGAGLEWIVRKIMGKKAIGEAAPAKCEPPPCGPLQAQERPPQKRRQKPAAKPARSSAKAPDYELPPPELLEKSTFAANVVTREHRDIAASMELNFNKYGIQGAVREIHPGPVVTRYDYEPEDGQRIAKIMETATDMRRAMATEQLRIALVSRTKYIGIEMANPNRQFVYYQTMMSSQEFAESKLELPLALGVDISGRPFYANLAKMPHVLIAGRTGSGKSVFVQSVITSIVYHNRPDEAKLVIVDPKGVDFNKWKGIPHLITPIVTDAAAAVNVLKWSVREMEERYKKLQEMETQNISDYNAMVEGMQVRGKVIKKKIPVGTDEEGNVEYEEREEAPRKMPYIVLIMDEIADLMQQARKEVEACVQRITQKARAAGIHLVAATQRPDVSVITGVIKSNLPTRISFQARSQIDSRTTLDQPGAEQLLAQGDMLYSESGKPPIRVHSAFVSDKEIEKIAKFLRSQGSPEYVEGITEAVEGMGGAAIGLPPGKDDKDADLMRQAVDHLRGNPGKRPSTSFIQRGLGIGYNKAAGIMERLVATGIVRETGGGKYELA